ncbi:hypothetical protein KAR91_86770 [Candidatus Pacearchaeota archaeon]|nr:hypothetical protein [Candidatus Pacearchaeota archaeon]
MNEDVTKLNIEKEHIQYVVDACKAEQSFIEMLDEDNRDRAELASLDNLDDVLDASLNHLVGYTDPFFDGLRQTHAWIKDRMSFLEKIFTSQEQTVEGA